MSSGNERNAGSPPLDGISFLRFRRKPEDRLRVLAPVRTPTGGREEYGDRDWFRLQITVNTCFDETTVRELNSGT